MNVSADRILKQVSKNAATIVGFGSALGSNITTILDDDCVLKTKLYGFNSTKKGLVIEVSINNVMLDRVVLSRKNEESHFQTKYKYDFVKMYGIRCKEPARPPVDEPVE